MVKNLNLHFNDDVHKKLSEKKGKCSWEEFIEKELLKK